MKLFYQSLNSSVRMPVIAFAPEDGGGGAEDAGNDEGGEDKPASSRFDDVKGFGGTRPEDQSEDDQGDKTDKDNGEKNDDKRPEWLNPKFKTAEEQARGYDNLYKLMRDKGVDPNDAVPETGDVAGYFGDGVELDESVDRLGLAPDDPGLEAAAKIFHKEGIGKNKAMRIVQQMFVEMNAHAPAPMNVEEELKLLGSNGRAVIEANRQWLAGMDRDGKLSDSDADVALGLLGTAAGNKLLNKFRSMAGEMPVPIGQHMPVTNGMSPEEWRAAYSEAIKNNDEKEQARLDGISAGVFGNHAASGSPLRGLG